MIKSTLESPQRVMDPSQNFENLEFQTIISIGTSDAGEYLSVKTDQITDGNFDFMQLIWDSNTNEKIYGLGL